MEEINFRNLLTDLYTLYNPQKINDIPGLLTSNFGYEQDAISNIFVKYNYKNHANHNPNVTDEYIKKLIIAYNTGDRPLSIENIKKQKEVEEVSLRDKIQKELEAKIPTSRMEFPFDININNFYQDAKVILPPDEVLAFLAIGSKIICKTEEKRTIALVVEDVTLDYITNTSRPTLEIIIDKALKDKK